MFDTLISIIYGLHMGESVALYSFRPDLPIGHIILPILNMFYQMNNFFGTVYHVLA